MPNQIPLMSKVGRLCNDRSKEHFRYLAIHPEQDIDLLKSCELDIGTPPGIRLVYDEDVFLLLATDQPLTHLSEETLNWIDEQPTVGEWDWYSCVFQVAVHCPQGVETLVLGYYVEDVALRIVELLTAPADLFQLHPRAAIGDETARHLFHFQMRIAGDDDDSSYHVMADSYETAKEIATSTLFADSNVEPGSATVIEVGGDLIATRY